MKSISVVVIGVCTLIFQMGCASSNQPRKDSRIAYASKTATELANLTEPEFRRILDRAMKGDAKAAARLAEYYGDSRKDPVAGWAWMKRAAELGHPFSRRMVQEVTEYWQKKGKSGPR